MNSRFYFRYHPINSLKNWRHVYGARTKGKFDPSTASISLFRFDYVFELQSIMLPATRDLTVTKHMVLQFIDINDKDLPEDLPEEFSDQKMLRESHFKLLHIALWRKIRSLCRRVAEKIHIAAKSRSGGSDAGPPPTKKARVVDKLANLQAAIGVTPVHAVVGSTGGTAVAAAPLTPDAIVEDEIARYMKLKVEDDEYCSYSRVPEWWAQPQQTRAFPCLSQVAASLFAMKPGSGGLECDIGGVGDVVGLKRSSLDQGMVEATMMLKLNKDLTVVNPILVPNLGARWKDAIPGRLPHPEDYLQQLEDDDISCSL